MIWKAAVRRWKNSWRFNHRLRLFCSNDDMAIGAMNAIFASLNVPEDISVIGFDDIGISQYMTPRLSTVKRPVENISILGAEKILALIADPDTAAEKYTKTPR